MIKDLVSIITPCYNTGKLLPNLLESILSQDYPFVEMYAINDGSQDDTENVIMEYIPKFKKKGYSLNDRVGVSYIEKEYEDLLKGKKAVYKLNKDNSYSLIKDGIRGNGNIILLTNSIILIFLV